MKADSAYLAHIRDSVDRVLAYTKDGRDAFFADSKTQDAVIRNLEIVGEAVKNLSAGFRDAHPEVPWRVMARMRDTLIHRYFGVKLDLVWGVVANDLPDLRPRLDEYIEKLEPGAASP